jgi:DNA-binding transcriptional regulator YdaS (Cro superfamily)
MNELRKYLNKKHGNGVALAKALKVTPGAVWQYAEKQVPAERIYEVSRLTGIPIKKLRPDINMTGAA